MNEYITKAKQIISENIYMTIATASPDGKPWISPVFFFYDEKYNLYWVSNKDALHSKLINQNPQVAIVIFNSTAPEGEGDGVYFQATASELTNESEIKHAMKLWDRRATQDEFKSHDISQITGRGVWRIYKAVPLTISKLTEGEYINGQYVDKRVEIKLL